MVMSLQTWWPALVAAVMLGRGWAFDCPDKVCSCYHQHDQLVVANCSSLPDNGSNVVDLTLSPKGDTGLSLCNGQFSSFSHLKLLILRNASIYEVQNKTFRGANKIEKIDLSFNNITELDSTVFRSLDKLTTVLLRGNPIDLGVQEKPFLTSKSITQLDIGQCKIKKIPQGVFYGLTQLKHLYLDGNLIESIEYNSFPKELQSLDLSRNLIKNVQSGVFYALTNLKSLSLAGNPINCSCSLMNLIKPYKNSTIDRLEDDFNCTLPQKGELCLESEDKETRPTDEKYSTPLIPNDISVSSATVTNDYTDANNNINDIEQADSPDTQMSIENNKKHEENENLKKENQDTTKITSEDQDEKHTNIPIVTTSPNMDVETTSDLSTDDFYQIRSTNDSAISESTDSNDLKSKSTTTVSELKTSDKLTSDENDSTTVMPDDNSVSSTTETENNAEANNNSNDIEQADSPDTQISIENNKKHEENENLKKENQDTTKITSEDQDEKQTNIPIVSTGPNMDVDTTSDLSRDDFYQIIDSAVSESTDSNDLKSKSTTVSELKTSDKLTSDENDSTTVMPDDNSVSSTTENNAEANNNTNVNDNQTHPSTLNTSSVIEYNTGPPKEDFQEQGFINVTSKTPQVDSNITSSEFIYEETTESSGDHENDSFEDGNVTQSLTSTTETNNGPIHKESEEEEERVTKSSSKDPGNVSESELTDDLTSESQYPEATESPTLSKTTVNEQLSPVAGTTEFTTYETPSNETETFKTRGSQEKKVQEMAGTEVLVFTIGTILVGLVLFSIYKCRSSKNRQSMRNGKDIESNRGTELQDMASLLPKPEEKEEKKNTSKYEDKAPSSETVKLLAEQNENDSSNFIPVAVTQNKLEDKNSLNNNTPSSKVPLIKPEKSVTITPTGPIQRTKVKVGIIPDSIPRTPIFLQKTHNGTKNV